MARVANPPRTIARNALGYIENKIHEVNKNLKDADDLITRLQNEPTTTFTQANIDAFKTQLMDQAKTANSEAVKMYRWVLGEFSIPIPTAYTDAQVDAIDEDIRTFEDGT